MKKIVIIPARYASTRLPGKPLLDIAGKAMIVRVCEAVSSINFDLIAVATDDIRIKKVVEAAGYRCVMTRVDHVSGTDRLHEAAEKLGLDKDDIIINLQGDEPLMPSENLEQVAALLVENPDSSVATLYELVSKTEAAENSNIVKLVQSNDGKVLYFSRAGIPYDRDNQHPDGLLKRHVGVYAYRKSALDSFVTFAEGQLESVEKLEQLRFMENGFSIVAQKSKLPIPIGVDTQEDLDHVNYLFSSLTAK